LGVAIAAIMNDTFNSAIHCEIIFFSQDLLQVLCGTTPAFQFIYDSNQNLDPWKV